MTSSGGSLPQEGPTATPSSFPANMVNPGPTTPGAPGGGKSFNRPPTQPAQRTPPPTTSDTATYRCYSPKAEPSSRSHARQDTHRPYAYPATPTSSTNSQAPPTAP